MIVTTLVDKLDTIAGQHGTLIGSEIISISAIGRHLLAVFVVLEYELAPAYARFELYKPKARWQMLNIRINSDAASILPPTILDDW